jgi:uncharacterized protein (TIGR00304 family)
MKSGEIVYFGVMLIILGALIIFAGIVKEAVSSKGTSKGEFRGGGVVMIGPIPIIFGTDRESAGLVIFLAIILIVVSYILFRGRSG